MSIFTTHYRILFTFILAILLTTGCSDQGTATPPQSESTEAVSAEQQEPETVAAPAPQPAADSSAPSQKTAIDGKKIYQASCQACHANGVAGSPKFGDKEAWAPRIAKGNDALFSSVKNGLKAMPPKGACMSCSDDDLRAAIEYMVAQGS